MAGSYLLDTNVVVPFLNGESAVEERMRRAEEVAVASIVLGELFYGARNSIRAEANLIRVEAFAAAITVINCDAETGRTYGVIRHQLQRKGRPIPENDIWIAAIARQWNLMLITRDSDCTYVDSLVVERW